MNINDGKYDDIINLEHPTSKKHMRMSMEARAAQFAPFAALTGLDTAINEVVRTTSEKIELDDELKLELNMKLENIKENLKSKPKVKIIYFVKDAKKEGRKIYRGNWKRKKN